MSRNVLGLVLDAHDPGAVRWAHGVLREQYEGHTFVYGAGRDIATVFSEADAVPLDFTEREEMADWIALRCRAKGIDPGVVGYLAELTISDANRMLAQARSLPS